MCGVFVSPGTPARPKQPGAVGKAPGRGRVAHVRRVQGAGAEAGADVAAGVVEHGGGRGRGLAVAACSSSEVELGS